MGWFKRKLKGINTSTTEKKETPEGLWYKCPKCNTVVSTEDHSLSLYVCTSCGHHDKIGSKEYFAIIFDDNKFKELDANLTSSNPLNFEDTKKYKQGYCQSNYFFHFVSGVTDNILSPTAIF